MEFLLRGDDGLAAVVAELERGHEVGFGDFIGGAFIHHDVLVVADIDDVEIALSLLGVSRVGDELAVHTAHAHCAQRAGPRDVADGQCGGCADDAEDVGIVFTIRTEEDGLNLHFIIPALRKERTDGAVGEAAGENFFFRRTAFAFEVAAGELARRRGFLAVIDGEREEILAFLGFGGGDSRDDDDGFAELDGDGTVGLLGIFAGFDVDGTGSDLGRDFF